MTITTEIPPTHKIAAGLPGESVEGDINMIMKAIRQIPGVTGVGISQPEGASMRVFTISLNLPTTPATPTL